MKTIVRRPRPRLSGVAFNDALENFFVELELDHDLDAGDNEPSHDLRRVAESAVDPLEIAATLEAIGVTRRTIVDVFGHDDIFDLADHIYRAVPLRAAPAEPRRLPRPGGLVELGRGAIFAVPGLAFTNVLSAGGLHLPWWCLPLALTIGWSVGQVVASVGYTLRNRNDTVGGATINAAFLVIVPLVTIIGFALMTAASGSVARSVPAVGGLFVVYMVASAILLLNGDEVVLAWSLVPTLVAAAASYASPRWSTAGDVAIVTQILAVVVVVVGATKRTTFRQPRMPRLTRFDVAPAVRHGAHGALCGAGVSVVLTMAMRGQPVGGLGLVAWPLLLSLGAMEWQHRTLTSSLAQLTRTVGSVKRYARMAAWSFGRSLLIYTSVIVLLSVAAGFVIHLQGQPIPIRPLVAQSCIGIALMIDLIGVAKAGIRRVLRCWLVGAIACAAALITVSRHQLAMSSVDAWRLSIAIAVIVSLFLVRVSWRAVRSPIA